MNWRKREPAREYNDFDTITNQLAAIYGIDDLKRFLDPSKKELQCPLLLKNIEFAVNEIILAIEQDRKISIHIDIDSDGCTSGTLMYNYLRRFTENVSYFHAQRSLGHGVELSEHDVPIGTDLLIIIDSSTNSVDPCKRISEKGINIVVLDHHEQDVVNPYCILVNPQQEGCDYPNKLISGAVVAWKVCQLLDERFKTNHTEEMYDVVAIGLHGDLMSLMQYENRYIVHKGINNIKNIGIRALLEESKKDPNKVTANDIGFFIAPNINAACRMDRIESVLELMIETDAQKAKDLAKSVIEMNKERQKIQARFNEKLIGFVKATDKCSIIIDNEIGKGFKGLVAGDLSNKFQKAIVIVSEDEEDTYAGSYRSYGDFNLKSILNSIPEVMNVGGHSGAGGVRFKRSDLDTIQKYLNDKLSWSTSDEFMEYVMEFNVEELNEKDIKDIEKFYSLSGKGFETGRFLIRNIYPQKVDVIGNDKNTLRIPCVPMDKTYFCDEQDIIEMKSSATLMKFRTNEEYFSVELIGKEIEVVGTLNLNEFIKWKPYKQVIKTNQIFIDDYKVVE